LLIKLSVVASKIIYAVCHFSVIFNAATRRGLWPLRAAGTFTNGVSVSSWLKAKRERRERLNYYCQMLTLFWVATF
jgi:hypothetical protein